MKSQPKRHVGYSWNKENSAILNGKSEWDCSKAVWGPQRATFWLVKHKLHRATAGLGICASTDIYFLACLSFSLQNDFKSSYWSSLCTKMGVVWLRIYGWRNSPPYRWREKVNLFLGPPSGLTQALSDCSVAGVKLTFYYFSVSLFSSLWLSGRFSSAHSGHRFTYCFRLQRNSFWGDSFYLPLLSSMLFHGTEPSSSLPSSRLSEE